VSENTTIVIRFDNIPIIEAGSTFINSFLIPLLSIIGGFGVIGGIIWSCHPSVKDRQAKKQYINFEKNELNTEKEYRIFWGRFFFKKLQLMAISKEVQVELSYTPLTGPQDSVPEEVYTDIIDPKKNKRIVTIIDTTFFKNAETEIIFVSETSIMPNLDYTSKIHQINNGYDILVTNENPIEIKRFPVDLPSDFDLGQIPSLLKYGELKLNPYEYHDGTFQKPILFVNIPAKDGDNIGKTTINLKKKIAIIPS